MYFQWNTCIYRLLFNIYIYIKYIYVPFHVFLRFFFSPQSLDFALSNNQSSCEKFVELGGLKVLFPAFMVRHRCTKKQTHRQTYIYRRHTVLQDMFNHEFQKHVLSEEKRQKKQTGLYLLSNSYIRIVSLLYLTWIVILLNLMCHFLVKIPREKDSVRLLRRRKRGRGTAWKSTSSPR